MPEEPVEQPVVTLRGIEGGLRAEAALSVPTATSDDPVRDAAALNRYRHILETLERETAATAPDVLVTAQDMETSLFQSYVASEGVAANPLTAGGREVKFGKGLEDPLGWLRSLMDWIRDKRKWHPIQRPDSTAAAPLASNARIALLSDWGSGMYGAPVSANSIARTGDWDLLVHLGDIYYSGTSEETQTRFLDRWPTGAAKISRALNGNHEMYSGGYGYFDLTLPAFGQESSYFAMQSDDWLLAFLDTAYVDHAIDATQAAWLRSLVADSGDRRVALFSHHQLFSRFNSQGPKLEQALRSLLEDAAIAVWYWGHEHECMLYEPHASYGLRGRCLGHGGVPEARRAGVKEAAIEQQASGVTWRRVDANDASPSALVLDGPNPYIPGKMEKFSPHGYMTLELHGADLVERVHLPDSTTVYEGTL